MAKILVVEDDPDVHHIVRNYLLSEEHQVESAVNGKDGSALVHGAKYELIILDWQLPEKSGIDILKELRTKGIQTPVLMLTGKGTQDAKSTGLDSGADDYITKPFFLKEFGARVRALLRRPAPVSGGNALMVKGVELDVPKRRAIKDGTPVALQPKEFELLEFMMKHPARVFTPDYLIKHVWPNDPSVDFDALHTTLKRISKKVDPEGVILCTVHGVGYALETT